MRESFRRGLENYQSLAKKKDNVKSGSVHMTDEEIGLQEIESAIRYHEHDLANRRSQEVKVQRKIFHLQEEKNAVMKRLNERIASLDRDPGSIEKNGDERIVSSDERGNLSVDGIQVTEGMLLTDGEWGLKYHPDQTVSRRLRKRYAIEHAKGELRALLDRQIVEDEIGSARTHEFKKKAYGAFKEMRGREEEVGGWVAERLIKTFFKRISIDFDLDIEIMETDVYEDVEHKIDFVIRRKARARGVSVEAREDHQDLGVQFTMRNESRTLEHKRHQIERVKEKKERDGLRVEDVLLVSLPLRDVRGLYKKWEKKKSPGGPTELWSPEEKKAVFERVLTGILSPAEIQAQWRIVMEGMSES